MAMSITLSWSKVIFQVAYAMIGLIFFLFWSYLQYISRGIARGLKAKSLKLRYEGNNKRNVSLTVVITALADGPAPYGHRWAQWWRWVVPNFVHMTGPLRANFVALYLMRLKTASRDEIIGNRGPELYQLGFTASSFGGYLHVAITVIQIKEYWISPLQIAKLD